MSLRVAWVLVLLAALAPGQGNDAGVVSFRQPTGILPPQPVIPIVRIHNYGTATETIPAQLSISRAGWVVYTQTATAYGVAPGANYDLQFPLFAGDTGTYVLFGRTMLAGDTWPDNDTLSGSFVFRWTEPPFWYQMHDMPWGTSGKFVKDGAALCHGRYSGGTTCLYGFKGNNTSEFYRYHISGDTWQALESIPYSQLARRRMKKGAATCYNRYDTTVYALKGGSTLEFWRYDCRRDSWGQRPDLPYGSALKRVKGGGALALRRTATDDDWVYALKGAKTPEFYRFHVQGDTWQTRAPVPAGPSGRGMGDGSCLVNAGGDVYALKGGYNEFYLYFVNGDSWSARSPLPLYGRAQKKRKARFGTGMAFINDVVYCIKGGYTELWAYYTETDTWVELESIPRLPSGKQPKGGASLAYGSGYVWALKGNRTLELWRYDPGADLDAETGDRPDASATQSAGRVRPPQMTIGPNPARGFAFIRFDVPARGPFRVVLRDVTGREVLRTTAGTRQPVLDLRRLRAGVYLVEVEAAGLRVNRKLVIE